MKNIVIFFLAIIFVNTSCQEKSYNLTTINILDNHPEIELYMDDVASITYLHLDSDQGSFLDGNIRYITDNTIVVHEYRSGTIYLFSKEGGLKCEFNHRGRGPGEYSDFLMGILYDDESEEVYVIDLAGVIHVYSNNGKHRRRIDLPKGCAPQEVILLDKNSILIYDARLAARRARSEEFRVGDEDYFAPYYLISSENGTILDSLKMPINRVTVGLSKHLVKCTDGILLCNPENDTVFVYGRDMSITPILSKIPASTSRDPVVYINNCVDGGRYLFADIHTINPADRFSGKYPINHFAVDIMTNEIFKYKFISKDYTGKEFNLNPLNHSQKIFEKGCLYVLSLFELKQAYAEDRLSGKLKELVATLDEERDNDVLMMVKFF